MEVRPTSHPSAESLRALALGKLDDNTAAEVLSHLDVCPDCSKEVTAATNDDFLNRLRQVHNPSGTPAPAKPLAKGVVGPQRGAVPTTLHNVPPELADYSQYEVLRELGRGGMGVVYLAKNKMMDRLEVLKVLNKDLLTHSGALERFLREIRSAAKLSHPNVVPAYSAVQLGELLVFAMEYIDGEDLHAVVKARGPLPVLNACQYVQQAAIGLQHAFEKGMVHRDIKPQNLILAREGKRHIVKVLDFGLAKATREKPDDTGLTGEGQMMGTPDFMAPEQSLDAASADIRADIYSLGCTLYYLLTAAPPFTGKSLAAILFAHQSTEARPLNVVRPEVPEELASVVRKMMAKKPAQRYQTPAEVVMALGAAGKLAAKGAPPKSSPDAATPATEARSEEEKRLLRAETMVPFAVVAPATMLGQETPSGAPRDSLTAKSIPPVPARRAKRGRKPRPSAMRKAWMIGAAITAVLLLGLLGLWAGGVFKVKTKAGTIVLENVPADAEVTVDGETIELRDRDGKTIAIQVASGRKHQLQVKKEGFEVFGQEVELGAGGSRAIRVTLQPSAAASKPSPSVESPVDDKGFGPLFNGKDLTGWKTHPLQPGSWHVEKNILIGGNGPGGYLYTKRGDYNDFHLRVEARINNGGDGGIFCRTGFGPHRPHPSSWPLAYEAQISSTPQSPYKTGSLLAGIDGPVVSVRRSLVPPGEWFLLEVIAVDNHLTIKVNGTITAEYTDKKRQFSRGHIGLQQNDRRTVIEFRKIEIKELPPTKTEPPPFPKPEEQPAVPRPAPPADGFVPLFNGKDLTGWQARDNHVSWSFEEGDLIGRSATPRWSLLDTTKNDYVNFHLRMETMLTDGEGAGLSFRCGPPQRGGSGASYIATIGSPKDRTSVGVEKTGTLYIGYGVPGPPKVLATAKDVPLKEGEWFSFEVIATSNRIRVLVKGQTVVDYTDGKRTFTRGKLRILKRFATTALRFRKVEIKELK